jgi:uncharacterized protein with PIN domain
MARLVEGVYASCVVCRAWTTTGVEMGPFDVVCLRCAEEIANALPKPVQEPETTVYTCHECGETFTNKGKFMAHCRAHKREAEGE